MVAHPTGIGRGYLSGWKGQSSSMVGCMASSLDRRQEGRSRLIVHSRGLETVIVLYRRFITSFYKRFGKLLVLVAYENKFFHRWITENRL